MVTVVFFFGSQAFILFGEDEFLAKFNESYESIHYYMRRG